MEERLVFFQEPRLPCFVISKSSVVLMMSYGLAPVVQLMTDNFQTLPSSCVSSLACAGSVSLGFPKHHLRICTR